MFTLISCMFVAHFFGDFLFQPRAIAKNKSTDPLILLLHVMIVSVVMFWATLIGTYGLSSFDISDVLMVTITNGVIHFCIDATTWNVYSFFNKRRVMPYTASGVLGPIIYEDKWWWTTLGLDQLLHGLTIIFVIFVFFA